MRIEVLDQETIDKIAAGEVVERPSSVAKELVENSIDAGASAITVEMKDGGITLLRITDDGKGIPSGEVQRAFLRHSTSKLRDVSELDGIRSLGFRGEALSSIAAVSRVEMITKTKEEVTGTSYIIEGGREKEIHEIGAPEGTTFFVRQIFYNTPARKKFLKSPMTEGNYVTDVVEKLAISHPEISFRLLNNGREVFSTPGNGSLKDTIYQIFGREITTELIEVDEVTPHYKLTGFVGRPVINRGNRTYELFFVDGRYVKSDVLSSALEDGYMGHLMQHRYPFACLNFDFEIHEVDVNVHPTKQEVRFSNRIEVYNALVSAVSEKLKEKEDINTVSLTEEKSDTAKPAAAAAGAEPFEKKRLSDVQQRMAERMNSDMSDGAVFACGGSASGEVEASGGAGYHDESVDFSESITPDNPIDSNGSGVSDESNSSDNSVTTGGSGVPVKSMDINMSEVPEPFASKSVPDKLIPKGSVENLTAEKRYTYEQQVFLTPESVKKHRIIGQVFDTYWLVEFDDCLYMIDQHAAHEKVLYERTMERIKDMRVSGQHIDPPILVSLSASDHSLLFENKEKFERLGYDFDDFGDHDIALTQIPVDLFGIEPKGLFTDMVGELSSISEKKDPEIILERIASMSCKAAVKGHDHLSMPEIEKLIEDLLSLDDPYHCPHGRPTIVRMTHYELDKKFKRIV